MLYYEAPIYILYNIVSVVAAPGFFSQIIY